MLPVLTASNAVAAGRMMRITPLVPIGTTTTRTIATTILACVWLCPRIDILVNSWTRVSVSFAYRNVAAADRMSVVLHSIEFFIRKTRSAQMYKDVHLCAMSSVAVVRAHTNSVNRPWWKMYILVHFSSTSLRLRLKHRCCVEPAASVPLLKNQFCCA